MTIIKQMNYKNKRLMILKSNQVERYYLQEILMIILKKIIIIKIKGQPRMFIVLILKINKI